LCNRLSFKKKNVIADALNHKNKAVTIELNDCDEKELLELRKINANIEIRPKHSLIAQLKVRSMLQDKVLEAQQKDVEVGKIRDKLKLGIETPF